jgi:hypothetical protein
MAMTSLKRTAKEAKESFDIGPELDRFPVSVHLSEDEVDKLGLGQANAGDEMMLAAKVKVTHVSQHQSEGQDKRSSVTLAVTEAEVTQPDSKTQAERIFPGNE